MKEKIINFALTIWAIGVTVIDFIIHILAIGIVIYFFASVLDVILHNNPMNINFEQYHNWNIFKIFADWI